MSPLADVIALRVCADNPNFVGDGAHHVLAQPGSLRTEGVVSASRPARKRCSGSVCARSSARR